MPDITIAIASDHAGVALKSHLIALLEQQGYGVLNLGTDSEESVDYPDFAEKLVEVIEQGKAPQGILICGSGVGISIAANRHKSIRAALCMNEEMASLARQHNDANVLALGARFIDNATAEACVQAFLRTEFEGGRHQRRVDKLRK